MSEAGKQDSLGFVYVDRECCTQCGVPTAEAPGVFEWGKDSCFVQRQPQSVVELRNVLRVFRHQELDCVRYAGNDPRVRGILERVAEENKCDIVPRSSIEGQGTACDRHVDEHLNDDKLVDEVLKRPSWWRPSWWRRLFER